MALSLAVPPPVIPCKICASASMFVGHVDFQKSCIDPELKANAPSGILVPYHRCHDCGLLFSAAFDHWSKADFNRSIYNDDYVRVDPEYVEQRPREMAGMLALVAAMTGAKDIFDFGGGNGTLASLLREKGFEAISYDPMHEEREPQGHYSLVSAIEVFEHTPAPRETFLAMAEKLKPDGLLVFSTTCLPADLADLSHPYIAPRNGHITIHSEASLAKLAESCGFSLTHYDAFLHIAMRRAGALQAVG